MQIKSVELASVVAALEKELGFPSSRTRSVARRLSEAGTLPAGSPGTSPMLDTHDLGTLLLGLASDVTVAEVPEAVARIDRLVPEGCDNTNFPEEIKARVRGTAGHHLDTLLALAAEGGDALRHMRIEIVSSWPEFALHWSDGSVQRWREPGVDPTIWGAGHRRAVTIPGVALFNCITALFSAERADAA